MTVAQSVKRFGEENCSNYVRNAYRNGNLDWWVWWVHATEPNYNRDPGRADWRGKPWISVWFENGAMGAQGGITEFSGYQNERLNKLAKVAGFDEFPALCPRWETTAEDVYGHCPGMDALGDTRALQFHERMKAQAVAKIVAPPMAAPSTLRASRLSLLPGDVVHVDTIQGGQKFEPAMTINPGAIQAIEETIGRHEGRIEDAFYSRLMLMVANDAEADPQKTAREIAEMHEEKMLQLGPVLENLDDELLNPAIIRTFNICLRRGLLPPPPQELQGQAISIEMVSVMAQAQKMLGLSAVNTLVQFATSLAQIRPDAVDSLNADAMVEEVRELAGAKQNLLLTPDQVAQVRAQRAKQQQAAATGQAMAVGAKAMKDASGANMDGDNGLTRMLQALGNPGGAAPSGAAS
jgi:hypothetical protein